MKLLGITACPNGMALTYMAAEKLKKAARTLGVELKVETQGAIGVENELTQAEIDASDGIIIVADKLVDKSRFAGKRLIESTVTECIRNSETLIWSFMKEGVRMKQDPIFLIPVFKERIWGGTRLRDEYGYRIPSEQTGECWAISGHSHGPSVVRDGEWEGQSLDNLWRNQPQLFGRTSSQSSNQLSGGSSSQLSGESSSQISSHSNEVFPLLTKILDAGADLSVQVHPDDAYGMKYEHGEHGKTECWYIIDCDDDAEIIYGHTATKKSEFAYMVNQGEWDRLLRTVPIRKGDFIYVPSGTIHALRAGTLVLETQQSSDTTYRVYDYDRKDAEGKSRELHIQKAMEVTNIPHADPKFTTTKHQFGDLQITTFIESEFFNVYEWVLDGEANCARELDFLLVSVLDGNGEIITENGTFGYYKGDHMILPHGITSFNLRGKSRWIVSGVVSK